MKELKQRYENKQFPDSSVQLPFNPTVCICAADDVKKQVDALSQNLEQAGCTLWENLMEQQQQLKRQDRDTAPGTSKSREIRRRFEEITGKLSSYPNSEAYVKHGVNNEIDYVIVVQSPELLSQYQQKKLYNYYIIRYALERQQKEKSGSSFVIPITTEQDGSNFQVFQGVPGKPIDISTDKVIEEIVHIIKRDCQLRQNG